MRRRMRLRPPARLRGASKRTASRLRARTRRNRRFRAQARGCLRHLPAAWPRRRRLQARARSPARDRSPGGRAGSRSLRRRLVGGADAALLIGLGQGRHQARGARVDPAREHQVALGEDVDARPVAADVDVGAGFAVLGDQLGAEQGLQCDGRDGPARELHARRREEILALLHHLARDHVDQDLDLGHALVHDLALDLIVHGVFAFVEGFFLLRGPVDGLGNLRAGDFGDAHVEHLGLGRGNQRPELCLSVRAFELADLGGQEAGEVGALGAAVLAVGHGPVARQARRAVGHGDLDQAQAVGGDVHADDGWRAFAGGAHRYPSRPGGRRGRVFAAFAFDGPQQFLCG